MDIITRTLGLSDKLCYKFSRSQKEAVGLLQIGTFLEYFDLMLYIHMAVLLNELFFPKADPFTASLVTAFSFSMLILPVSVVLGLEVFAVYVVRSASS